MTVVVDASAVVAALIDTGPVGQWAESRLRSAHLIAPQLLPAEVANVLRRIEAGGAVSHDAAALALADLDDIPVDLFPMQPFLNRVWQLRRAVNAYDAWYVAIAEAADSPLITLDQRLATAPGPECEFVLPRST